MATATVPEKRSEFEKLSKSMREIIEAAKTKNVGLTGEEITNLDRMEEKRTSLREEIEAEVKRDDYQKSLVESDRWFSDPQRSVPHGVNGDDEGRKALQTSGWEFKGGIIYGPTSLIVNGQPFKQPMYSEEVLYGDIPTDDHQSAEYIRKTRATFAPDYKTAFVKHMRVLAKTRDSSQAWNALTGDEHKALNEGSDTAGGFLVPPDAMSEMLARTAQMSVIRGRARVQPTSSDILKWPAVAPNSVAANSSIFSSGFVGGWVGETPAFSDTDPTFQTFNIPVKKLRVATKLSNDFVQDAQVNVLSFLAQNGAENMALVEDQGFINGDGGPLQPAGLLGAGSNTVSVEGVTTNQIDNNTTVMGSADGIINLAYALPAAYLRNASWLMQRATEGKVRLLRAGTGGYLWPGGANPGFAAVQRTLLDYPIDNSDFMPPTLVDGNKVIVFGDLSQYIIAQRAQISSRVLNERFADTDQVGIILFERVGGGIWNTDAIRYGIV